MSRADISGAVVLESGDLRVEFETERVRRATITFRLRATNAGSQAVRCLVSTSDPRAHASKISLLDLRVAARDSLDAAVEVRRRLAPGVVAEFAAPGQSLFVHAPDPALRTRRIARRPGASTPNRNAALASLAAVAALLVSAWLAPTPLHPRVEALSVPPSVAAGGDLQIAYALGGTSTGTYRLRDASGAVIDSGPVASSDGSLTIKAPTSAQPGEYSVEVSAAPELAGSFHVGPIETRAASFALLAANGTSNESRTARKPRRSATPTAPVVDSAALEKDTVSSGQPIVVSYATTSTAGEVRLIDDRGTVRAEALINHSGNSILVAPQVDVDQDFKVALNVDDGSRHEERLLPVRIVPSPGPTSAPSESERASALKVGKPFVLVLKSIPVGDPLELKIVHPEPDMRVGILDKDGNEIANSSVAPGQTFVQVKPPPNTPAGSYTVDVSYRDASGQEHAIAPFVVRPTP